MITPAFNLTATERVLPRLALDFTTGVLDNRVTVTRALNTATRVNSSGFIENVNANLPRFDYDPATLAAKGLLIEETRTNIKTYSEDLNSAAIALFNASVSTDAGASPRGTNDADKLVENTSNASHSIDIFTPVSGTAYVLSFYAKQSGRSRIQFSGGGFAGQGFAAVFDFANGTMAVNTGSKASIVNAGNGYYRCIVAFTPSNTINFNLALANNSNAATYLGDGVSGAFIYGLQIETGTFATSYIPNLATGTTTRNADVVSMTGTNFSSWYVSSSAAISAFVVPSIATGTRPVWQFDDTTANEIIALRGNVANPELYIVDNGAPQAQLDAGTITANTQYGLCATFAANNCAVSQNGAAPVTTATATMPTVTQARIGSDGVNFLNGVVRTLRYWPQRILNAETQAFSK